MKRIRCWSLLSVWCCLLLDRCGALDLRDCRHALGMETGRLVNDALTASSSFDHMSTGPQNARIRTENGGGAWCPQPQINAETKEWLQIDLGVDTVITAVETQGRYGGGQGLEYPPGYSLEYWRPSLGGWAQYKDRHGNEVIKGNRDTRTAVIRELDGAIIARKIRFIPHSQFTRTVCMRVELFGCEYKEMLVSYKMPQGAVADGLDMRDSTYDGKIDKEGLLSGGFGQLFDGIVGGDNFETHPHRWVGWRNDHISSSVTLLFEFADRQNVSAVLLFTSNSFNRGAQVFNNAKIYFRPSTTDPFSDRFVDFEYVSDKLFDTSRWVRIPTPQRVAKQIKVVLTFASDWLLLSEVRFESGKVPYELPSYESETVAVTFDKSIKAQTDTVAYFAIDDMPSEYIWLVTGVGLGVFGICSMLVLLFYMRYRKLRPSATVFAAHMSKLDGPKEVQVFLDNAGTLRINTLQKKSSPSSYRMAADNMENSLLEKLPKKVSTVSTAVYKHRASSSSRSSDSSEYAEPDTPNLLQSMAALPLLPPASPDRSVHYAASELFGRDTASRCSSSSPLASSAKYACFSNPIGAHDWSLVEIPRESLQFRDRLGEGEFGEVHLCQLERRLVAVKMLRPSASEQARRDFEKEMHVLARLRHPNIVEVVGACTDCEPWCCIVEFMGNGDLNQFLQRQAHNLSYETLVSTATQVAAGMSYLESQHFVHRDLAARNCLVGEEGTVKIADFGMTRSLYSSDYYRIEGAFVLPIRWMAWECLLLGKFTSKSDVWAFGVTLWEIFTKCRSQPFAYLTDPQVIDNIQHIYHQGELTTYLDRPEWCPNDLFQLMTDCWKREETERPSFDEIHLFLQRKNLSLNLNC